ncbi:MAG TPA: prolyl oligopeptidase family serine peptidase [Actinomycetes bacterium]|nr:prolyl oligopeptidase family serine peptidase [Actinomycetes bacterium]
MASSPDPAAAATAPQPKWEQRFRAVRVSLPDWAQDAPARTVYVSNATGTFEVYAWDRASGSHRQVTARRNGTSHATIDPSGQWIWWFDDTDGDEFGVWRRQPFGGGPDAPAAAPLSASYPAGLGLGPDGLAVVGRATEGRTTIHRVRADAEPVTLYEHTEDASVGALSRDGALVAIEHSEHGDSRHPALRVLRVADASAVAELWDGPGKGLEALEFAPVPGDPRLLVQHERHGRPELLIWDVLAGTQTELTVDLPGEISAQWYVDGRALLVAHDFEARTTLHRLDLDTGELTDLGTPPGVVDDATTRPDGSVEYLWSSAATPPAVRSTTGRVVLATDGPPAPPSVPVEDAWVDGPAGRIHALVSRPASDADSTSAARAPYPTVFLVHGGPTWLDSDAFAADVAAWVDHGFAVVRVNYRGSIGYGSAWRDALEGRVGLTELEDVAAVRAWAVESGLADPARLVLAGGSWGGFLTLLGLGTQPDLWTVGVAAVPVADYVAAYDDEMDALQAFDRSLFGGSPEQVPERYRESSPITYVDQVRAPVLVLAGANDPRCPIRQIDNYLAALAGRSHPHEVYRFDAGHGSLVVDERVRQMRAELDFALRHLPPAKRA